MKAIIEFDMPQDTEKYVAAMRGAEYRTALRDIWEQMFRPYFKHGYSDQALQDATSTDSGGIVIERLADRYRDITENLDVFE